MGFTVGLVLSIVKLNLLMLIEPLPYPDQSRLYVAHQISRDQNKQIRGRHFSYRSLFHLYNNQSAFSRATPVYYSWELIVDHPQQPPVNTALVSPEYFDIFNVPMALGRGFESSESVKQPVAVAVISYQLWEKYFNLKDDILRKNINLGGVSYQIIGVSRRDFIEPKIYEMGRSTDIWLPWGVESAWYHVNEQWDYAYDSFAFIGKLKSDVSVSQAEQLLSSQIGSPAATDASQVKMIELWSSDVTLMPIQSAVVGSTEKTGIYLLLAVFGLLAIASTNIINLFVSRIAENTYHLAIYAVLGAKKRRLFLIVFYESLLLFTLSGLLACCVAFVVFEIMQNQFQSILPRVNELIVGKSALIILVGLIITLSFILSMISANAINQRRLNSYLMTAGKGVNRQLSSKLRNYLITIQIMFASILILISIALLLEALAPIVKDKGINFKNVFELYLTPHSLPFESPSKRIALTKELKRRLRELPQVIQVSHSNLPIVKSRMISSTLSKTGGLIHFTSPRIDHQYFSLVEKTILQGENFSIEDVRNQNRVQTGEVDSNANRVAIVNQTMANRFKPDGSVINESLEFSDGLLYRIIGVVNDSYITSSMKPEARVYTPSTEAGFSYLIKFKEKQAMSRQVMVSLVASITSSYAPYGYERLDEKMANLTFVEKTTAIIAISMSIVVFALATIGIYGVINYNVQNRTFELGTRLALGAHQRSILFMVITENLRSILRGVGFSLLLAVIAMITVEHSFVKFVNYYLWAALVINSILIISISLLACYFPLRKIIRQPVVRLLRGYD